MTRAQLDHSIATRTGESVSLIRRLGFHLMAEPREEPTPEALTLVVHCPFCREQVPYPGRTRDGSTPMAECADCDVFFPFQDRDVFPASVRRVASPSPARHRYIPA